MHKLALVVVSGPGKGTEFLVKKGQDFVLGRGKDVDLVIDDPKASRRHARFFYDGNDLFVEDLGSYNGTFVNGNKVQKALLFSGDSIEVGALRVKATPHVEQKDETKFHVNPASTKPGQAVIPTMGNVLSDTLTPQKLREMMKFLAAKKKTGVLVVHTGWGTGRIHFDCGELYFAGIDGAPAIRSMKALQRLLRTQEGYFEFSVEPAIETTDAIRITLEALFEQDAAGAEEFAKLEQRLPVPAARLLVTEAGADPAGDFTAKEKDALRLAKEHGVLGQVMDAFDGSDAEAIHTIIGLTERGCLRWSK